MRRYENKRVQLAYNEHQRSIRDVERAKRRIENFTMHLFTALKDQEKALATYNVTADRLNRAQVRANSHK